MTDASQLRRARQFGYTLVEILVSLLLGAILIGAVLSVVAGTGVTGRRQDSQAQLAEDGQVALNMLANHLRMAGLWIPPSPLVSLESPQLMLLGCRNSFSNPTIANFADLTCTAGTGNDSIAMRYFARDPDGSGTPRDCLGNEITAADGWADNRFYIADGPSGNPALYCRGNGGGGAQVLIDNVESMQLRYGIAAVNGGGAAGPIIFDRPRYAGQTIRYVRANDLTSACSSTVIAANSWCSVVSVRICLIMRANANSAENGFSYTDCDGTQITPADRRIRRAITTTVSLRNRTS